jgi:hypothetical protein
MIYIYIYIYISNEAMRVSKQWYGTDDKKIASIINLS